MTSISPDGPCEPPSRVHTLEADPSTSEPHVRGRNAAQGPDHSNTEETPSTWSEGRPHGAQGPSKVHGLPRVILQLKWGWERALPLGKVQRPRKFRTGGHGPRRSGPGLSVPVDNTPVTVCHQTGPKTHDSGKDLVRSYEHAGWERKSPKTARRLGVWGLPLELPVLLRKASGPRC